jgi:hypothetical protein
LPVVVAAELGMLQVMWLAVLVVQVVADKDLEINFQITLITKQEREMMAQQTPVAVAVAEETLVLPKVVVEAQEE